MAMSASSGGDGSEPMMDINTTPLIDVMLVLLIMFIITLPRPTHAVKIDLPQDCEPNCPPLPPVLPTKNVLYIYPNNAITWNGLAISERQLYDNLMMSQDTTLFPETPELHFQPDPDAVYDTVDRVLMYTKKANVTKMGFIGNENYRGIF
jgi:biopolymer transport protein ExbD